MIPSATGNAAVPHPRSYGPYPRKLRRYALDEKVLTLERAIHSMTGLPAAVFRVRDRGTIRPGAHANVVVLGPAAVRDRATYERRISSPKESAMYSSTATPHSPMVVRPPNAAARFSAVSGRSGAGSAGVPART